MILVCAAGRGLLQFARNFGFEFAAQRVERNVRRELYTSLIGKSMTFHNLQPVGDTMARATNDVREVNFLFSPGLNMVVGSLTFLIFPLIAAPRYHRAADDRTGSLHCSLLYSPAHLHARAGAHHRRGARILWRTQHPPGRIAGRG